MRRRRTLLRARGDTDSGERSSSAIRRIVKDVSDEMLEWKTEGTALYQALPRLHATLKAVEPLREVRGRAAQEMSYKPGETKS
jgi:hypothetical protein